MKRVSGRNSVHLRLGKEEEWRRRSEGEDDLLRVHLRRPTNTLLLLIADSSRAVTVNR
jgi:hypothetical protein